MADHGRPPGRGGPPAPPAEARKLPLLVQDNDELRPEPSPGEVADERLRLVFTCCHPALALEAQVALTLRVLCGLTSAEVARAFLVSESTMATRITRAKKKIAAARIPYSVPPLAELPARVGAVATVVHLLFTTGHTAPAGADLVRADPSSGLYTSHASCVRCCRTTPTSPGSWR